MRHSYILLLAGLGLALGTTSTADNIHNDLKESAGGTVTIHESATVTKLLEKKKAEADKQKEVTYSGYRVQVYKGNNQRVSKGEAESRESRIKARFPNQKTYLTFDSPFWNLRVGDFRTHADALVLAHDLKNAFPNMAGEIYVIRDANVINTDAENN